MNNINLSHLINFLRKWRVFKKNRLSGVLDIGAARSSQLRVVDLQNNNISSYTQSPGNDIVQIMYALIFSFKLHFYLLLSYSQIKYF